MTYRVCPTAKMNSAQLKRRVALGAVLLVAVGFISSGLWSSHNKAEVEVIFSHFEDVPGGKVAVFQVSNIGKRAVTMYGGPWPEWLILRYDGTNWDSSYSPGFDFGAAKPIGLRPGARVAMPTFLPDFEPWVVGVGFTTASYAPLLPAWARRIRMVESFVKSRMKAAWSEPITRSSKPTNLVPPLGPMTNQIRINSQYSRP
jgi:hypothetical protein